MRMLTTSRFSIEGSLEDSALSQLIQKSIPPVALRGKTSVQGVGRFSRFGGQREDGRVYD